MYSVSLMLFIFTFYFLNDHALSQEISFESLFTDDDKESRIYDAYIRSTILSIENREREILKEWEQREYDLRKKWGSLTEMPSQKRDVSYSDKDDLQTIIDYEGGEATIRVKVDHSQNINTTKNRAIQALAVATRISPESFPNKSKEPTEKILKGIDGLKIVELSVRMVPNHVEKRMSKYLPLVRRYADKNRIPRAFVLGIIRQESSFNPRAQSHIPAFGLMQIVPRYAGMDVTQAIEGRPRMLDAEYLFDPENSIRIGTSYLRLLYDRHYHESNHPLRTLSLLSSSYNWGPGGTLQSFKRRGLDPLKMEPQDVYNHLTNYAPLETRNYVKKVLIYTKEFQRHVSMD